MNKKKVIILLIIVFIGILFGTIYVISKKNKRVNYITDYEFLYDIAIDYLKEKYTKEETEYNEKQDFNVFLDYKGFGISEKDGKRFAYMWILEESYYKEEGELKSGSGSSMPYKITFVDNKVFDVEVPKDGTYYVSSIKEMFPDDIENKILNYNMDFDLEKQVKDYYDKISVILTLDIESLTSNSARFIMENNTDIDYYYGPEYSIEKYEDYTWKTIEPKEVLSWNAVVFTIKSNEKQEININWDIGYDKLEAGSYRIVKKLTPVSDETTGSIKVYGKFELVSL